MLDTTGNAVKSGGDGVMGMLMALLATKREGKELWAVLLFIIFVIIILVVIAVMFTRDRRHDGANVAESVTPLIAAAMVAKQPQHYDGNYSHDAYDFAKFAKLESHTEHLTQIRDTLIQSGEVKEKIVEKQAESDAKTAQYFYQTDKAIEASKFEAYRVTKESEEKVLLAVAESERRAVERAEREKDAKIAHQAMIIALAYRPQTMGNHANIQQISADMGYGYSY
jgi:hypothetical protein